MFFTQNGLSEGNELPFKCGLLYNHYAVDNELVNLNGWHVPSDIEWEILIDYIGGRTNAGTKLKSISWWKYNANGTNDYGFTALPTGNRSQIGLFRDIYVSGVWWSTTEINSDYAKYYNVSSIYDYIFINEFVKISGFSVRCVNTNIDGLDDGIIVENAYVDGSGNNYDAVAIGTQLWTIKNLATKQYQNGVYINGFNNNGDYVAISSSDWSTNTIGSVCAYKHNMNNVY